MPRVLDRRSPRQTLPPLSRRQIWTLLLRDVLIFPDPDRDGPGFGPGWTGIDAAWRKHREALLAYWDSGRSASLHGLPLPVGRAFTRPWAWWMLDAKEPRRQIAAPDDPSEAATWEPEFWGENFGLPYGASLNDPAFETQRAYLTRLGLLTARELALLKEVSRA